MASLTPGVLSKLLENVGDKTVKVAGEHRSALLQVIGIVPSLAGADDTDPWKSKGFFLRVSDSVHSAYVSVTDEDTDLILSDKIQLGQFIHVARLDSGPSVPVLRGVKPVPKRRPCVGEPKDLISSDSLPNRSRVEFSSPAKRGPGRSVKRLESKTKIKDKILVRDDLKSRRLSFGNGNIEGLEVRRLSLDSSRKAWDRSPRAKNGVRNVSHSKSNEAPSSPDSTVTLRSARKDVSEKDLSVKYSSLSISPLKNKNMTVSPKVINKPVVDKKATVKSSSNDSGTTAAATTTTTIPSNFVKVPLSLKTWSDSKILWDSLPTTVHDVGMEVMSWRNARLWSAVNALEETSATESVLRCMSKFAELCELFKKEPTNPLVDRFLNLHQHMQEAASAVKIIVNAKSPQSKSATSWIQAAVGANLSNFTLLKREENKDLLEKCYYIVLENAPNKIERPVSNSSTKGLTYKSKQRIEKKEWSKGSGLKETATLAEKLISVSREWFLNYLDDSLKNGFGCRGEFRGGGNGGGGGVEVAALLGQLKRVNEWLDKSVEEGDERVEELKKKLYGFLLDQVNSSASQRV